MIVKIIKCKNEYCYNIWKELLKWFSNFIYTFIQLLFYVSYIFVYMKYLLRSNGTLLNLALIFLGNQYFLNKKRICFIEINIFNYILCINKS